MNDRAPLQDALREIHVDGTTGEFETARSVAATETVAAELTSHAREAGATAIASFIDADDAVIAHLVARALDVPRATVEEDMGLLTLSPGLPDGSRVAFIGIASRSPLEMTGALSLLEGRGFDLTDPIIAAQL